MYIDKTLFKKDYICKTFTEMLALSVVLVQHRPASAKKILIFIYFDDSFTRLISFRWVTLVLSMVRINSCRRFSILPVFPEDTKVLV